MEVDLDDLIFIWLWGKINPPILNQSHALNSLWIWLYFSKIGFTRSYSSNYLLSLFYFCLNLSCSSPCNWSTCYFRTSVLPISLRTKIHHYCPSKNYPMKYNNYLVWSYYVLEIFVGGFLHRYFSIKNVNINTWLSYLLLYESMLSIQSLQLILIYPSLNNHLPHLITID